MTKKPNNEKQIKNKTKSKLGTLHFELLSKCSFKVEKMIMNMACCRSVGSTASKMHSLDSWVYVCDALSVRLTVNLLIYAYERIQKSFS